MKIEKINDLDDIELLFNKTLNSNEKIIYTILSDEPIIYLLSEEFGNNYVRNRVKKGIFLKSLRLSKNVIDKPQHSNYSNIKKEVRIHSENIDLGKSIIIFDDIVSIIDTKEQRGIMIENESNAKVMKYFFNSLWEKSE